MSPATVRSRISSRAGNPERGGGAVSIVADLTPVPALPVIGARALALPAGTGGPDVRGVLRARVSIREVWLPRTTVRPRPSRSRPLGTCASRNSSRSTNVRTARLPPPTRPTSRMSAETPAMRRSPSAGPCRLRSQTARYACQFGRLASTSSLGAWTPCAASSAAVDALGSGPVVRQTRRPRTGAARGLARRTVLTRRQRSALFALPQRRGAPAPALHPERRGPAAYRGGPRRPPYVAQPRCPPNAPKTHFPAPTHSSSPSITRSSSPPLSTRSTPR